VCSRARMSERTWNRLQLPLPLQHIAAQNTATLHHTASYRNTLHHTAAAVPKHPVSNHLAPQQTATHCTTLQHTAPHCNTLATPAAAIPELPVSNQLIAVVRQQIRFRQIREAFGAICSFEFLHTFRQRIFAAQVPVCDAVRCGGDDLWLYCG